MRRLCLICSIAAFLTALFGTPGHAAWKLSRTIDLPNEPKEFTISPDGKSLVVGYKDGSIEVREFESSDVLHEFQAHGKWLGSMYFTNSGDHLVTVGEEGRIWSTSDWEMVSEIPYVKFHGNLTPDERWIVALNGERKAMIWDIESGEVVADLEMDGGVYQIGFTNDGRWLLTALSRRSMILDLGSGDVIDPSVFGKKRSELAVKVVGENQVTVSMGSFADDDAPVHLIEPGKTSALAALGRAWAGKQEFVDVIDLDAMKRVARLKPKEGVTYCSFSHDDTLLAIQGSKATVWRIKNGKRVASLDGSGKVVFSTTSPDLLVADGNTLRVYSSR